MTLVFRIKIIVKILKGIVFIQDSVPRPVARISVTVVALTVTLFVLKSFLSTAFFVLVCYLSFPSIGIYY